MKRKLVLSCLMAGVSAAVSTARAAGAMDSYQDWQLNAVTIHDTNAWNNVRNQMDFTRPLHGPWLTNPGYDTMTVSFVTRVRCGAAVEYREKGTETFVRRWQTSYGQIDYSDDVHTVFLTGLKPGTEYEYRLVDAMNSFETPYTEIIVGRETYAFRTLDPKRDRYRAWFTADFHGTSRLCLDPMYENSGAASADLYFFLGDNVEDRFGNEPMFYITFGFLDDVTRLWGSSRPSVFCRGNHDIQGREFNQWARFFARADGRAYYTVAQGPVLFVILDLNREWHRAPAALEQYENYMREQVEWFKALRTTDAWKKATFRIVMDHYGTHYDGNGGAVEKWFGRLLNDPTPEGRVHALLAGHEHRYLRHDPNSFILKGLKQAPKRPLIVSDQYNYCQVIGRQCEALTVDVSPEKLVFTSHDWKTPGQLVDKFEILPDGCVNDLCKDVPKYDGTPVAIKSGDTVAFVGGLPHDSVVRALRDAGLGVKPVVAERLDQGVLAQKPNWVIMAAGADSKDLPAAAVDRLRTDGAKIVLVGSGKAVREFAKKRDLPVVELSGNPDGETVANEIVKTLASSLDDTGRPVFVIDRIASLERYQRLNPNFAAAFKFIKEKGWETQTPKDGKFYIDGEKVFAFVNEVQLKPWSQKLVEAHDEYIDIQIPLDGNEVFGVGRIDPRAPKHPTCADGKDIRFRVQDLFPVTVHPGEFAIFFPPVGAHAPCCSDGQSVRVKKLVVKVRTN